MASADRSGWFDRILQIGQYVLLAGALLFLGFWAVDGPLRDWQHARAAEGPVILSPALIAIAPDLDMTVPATSMPIRTASRASNRPAPADEFIAPRQSVPALAAAAPPEPTHLIIPSIAVDTPIKQMFVVDGEWEVVEYAAGYLHGTGLPGDPGNLVVGGHAGLGGGVFRNLGALAPGADVFVDAAGWRYRYRVREAKAVWPYQIEVLDPTPTATMTLLTCTNWDIQRLVVSADLVDAKPLPRA